METIETEENTQTLTDYLKIVKRRKNKVMIPILILIEISIIVALVLPPLYRSEATISIEDQHIPLDFVKSTVSSYADQRIQQISQRIMARDQVIEIITKFNLYPYKKGLLISLTDSILKFRDSVDLEVDNQKVISRGKKSMATLSFYLTFDHKNPVLAQKVVTELTTLFLNENKKDRKRRAEDTTEFLDQEANKFVAEIKQAEEKIATYKEKHHRSLPELLSTNLTSISKIETTLLQMELEEKMLRQRKMVAESQLLLTPPIIAVGDEPIVESAESLQAKYEALLRKYSTSHPTVKALKREIDRFNENTTDDKADNVKVNNPAYRQLENEIKLADMAQKNITIQRIKLNQKLELIEIDVANTPQVERGYYGLMRNIENYKAKYQELKSKALEAKLSESLEEEQKAEKFILLEPASLPDKPEKPKRLIILLVGCMIAVGSGLGLALLIEIIEGHIQSYKSLVKLTGVEPLVVIPYINNQQDLTNHQYNTKKISVVIISSVMIYIATFSIHFFYKRLYLMGGSFIDWL
jgi:polysaccharide chain length determinant protein (PEP-CTERM system associated)